MATKNIYQELLLDYVDLLDIEKKYGLKDEEKDKLVLLESILQPYLQSTGTLTPEKKEQIKEEIRQEKDLYDIAIDNNVSYNTVRILSKQITKEIKERDI